MSATEARSGSRTAPVGRMLLEQARSDLLQALRMPGLLISGMVLPALMFAFLGSLQRGAQVQGIAGDTYVLLGFATFATTNVMMLGFGLGISIERARGTDKLMRASPLPPAVHLLAKTMTATLIAAASLVTLLLLATLVMSVPLDPGVLPGLMVAQLLGAIPFVAIGMTIGYGFGPGAANAILNLCYLLLGFLSGVLVPLQSLPSAVAGVAHVLPTFRHAELTWALVGANSEPPVVSALWLVAYGVVFFALATYAYRSELKRKFA